MRFWLVIAYISLLSGCANLYYDQVKTGELKGKLTVEWIEPDKFVFRPDPHDPLTFIRGPDKDAITPGKMYTDGGSIPRPLWVVRSFSPWGYAPAFIVHDWLFEMQHCRYPGYEKYTVDSAATIMSEIMKTMMLNPKLEIGPDSLTLYAMYEAVKSPVAADLWRNGKCETPSIQIMTILDKQAPAKMQYVIDFTTPGKP